MGAVRLTASVARGMPSSTGSASSTARTRRTSAVTPSPVAAETATTFSGATPVPTKWASTSAK